MTLHAFWVIQDRARYVDFVTDANETVPSQWVPLWAPVVRPADPHRLGYIFSGWYTANGTAWDFSTPIEEDLTLFAMWTEDETWTPEGPDKDLTP